MTNNKPHTHVYVLLLRGINVGGKNRVPMEDLRSMLTEIGFTEVRTYIASGNVIVESPLDAAEVQTLVEQQLPRHFDFDSSLIRVHVLTASQFQKVVEQRPDGFGDEAETYHYDVIFLMKITAAEALKAFSPREDVDRVWAGNGVVYSSRLSAARTKSRLNRVMSSSLYASMTIRNWRTTTRLHQMLDS